MALVRGLKRGNVREFDASYQLGFTDIWAREVDVDLDILFDSWNAVIDGMNATVISPTPPPSPQVGQLWWRDQPDGALYIYYDDGNSTQWVAATPPVATKPDANQQLYDYNWKAGAVTVGTISPGQAGQQDSATLLVHHLDVHGTDQTLYWTRLMVGSHIAIVMNGLTTITGTLSAIPTAAPVIALKMLNLTGGPPTDGAVVEVIVTLPGDPCSEWLEVSGTLFPRSVYGIASSTGLGLALPNYNKPWAGQTISFGDPTTGNCTSIVGTNVSVELEVADQTAFFEILSNTQTGSPATSPQAVLQLASNQYFDVLFGNVNALHVTPNNVKLPATIAVGAATATPAAGMMQFSGGRFQGYNGTSWQNLDVQQIGANLWGGGKSNNWPYLIPLDASTTNVWIGGSAGARYYGFANGSGAGITTNYDSDADKLDSSSAAGWELDVGQVNSFQFLYYPQTYVHGQSATVLMRVNSTGTVTVGRDPANALDLATKQYVDARIGSGGGGGGVYIGATAPLVPTVGQLWWRTDPDNTLYIYYNDGTSSQWVPAVALTTNTVTTTVSFIYPGGPPATMTALGGTAYTYGQDFTVLVPNLVLHGVRLYKLAGDSPATRTATVWNQATQAQIATATFTAESPTGWQSVSFGSAPVLTAGTTYRVGVNLTGSGGSCSFTGASMGTGPNATMSQNGYYTATIGAFPTILWGSYWFGIDLMLDVPM